LRQEGYNVSQGEQTKMLENNITWLLRKFVLLYVKIRWIKNMMTWRIIRSVIRGKSPRARLRRPWELQIIRR
jgi:hypothetical protein